MATKRVTYKGSQIADTDEVLEGFAVNDEDGLYFVPDTNAQPDESQSALASKSHHVSEAVPIWNQITYTVNRNVIAGPLYEGHVTLYGLKRDGNENRIMLHYFNETMNQEDLYNFDLLSSACTGATIQRVRNGAGSAGTTDITTPLKYEDYGAIGLTPTWFDEDWPIRRGIPFEKSGGNLMGGTGRKGEYFVFQLKIDYDADMQADFSDIRFCGTDGLTELPHYQLYKIDSTVAVYLVAVPAYMVADKNEAYVTNISATNDYSILEQQYIWYYYGNATTTSASDVTLNGTMVFYDEFNDSSIDSTKWPTTSAPAGSSITEGADGISLIVNSGATATPSIFSSDLPFKFNTTTGYEIIWKLTEVKPLGTTYTTVNDGVVLRLRGDDNEHFDCRSGYFTGGAISGTTAGRYMGTQKRTGGSTETLTAQYYMRTTTTATRFIKAVIRPGASDIAYYASYDAYKWELIDRELIGNAATLTPSIRMYYAGANIATERKVKISGVYVYPTTSPSTDYWEDSFVDGVYGTIWNDINTGSGRSISETSSTIVISGTTSSSALWGAASWTAPTLYNNSRIGSTGRTENLIYETRITQLTTPGAGQYVSGGIALFNTTTHATSETIIYEVSNSAGTININLRVMSNGADTLSTALRSNIFSGTGGLTTPVWLRILVEKTEKRMHFQYSTDGINWITCYSHPIKTTPNLIDGYLNGTYQGLYMRNNAAINCSATFEYFKTGSGPNSSFNYMTPTAEQALTDYPILPDSPTNTDITHTFTLPGGFPRNTPMRLQLDDHGGDTSNSKITYVTDKDLISIGPDGLDKYIGMRLEFDFDFASTDEFQIKDINFLYEVI